MDERLAAIKQEGRRRRAARHRRTAAVAGVAAILGVGVPVALQGTRDRTPDAVYAARAECHNATDPNCGPARWDPEPAPNSPATATLEGAGSTPLETVVGRPVEVAVAWEDPDGPRLGSTSVCWDGDPCEPPAPACTNPKAYGVWKPPSPSRGSGTAIFEHTYRSPGFYKVTISLLTASWNREACVPEPLGDPYASHVTVTTNILVR